MEIKNLSQLKKALQKGRKFEVVEHYIKPDMTGIREVNVVQTNGIYSKFPNKPSDAKENTCNGGKHNRKRFCSKRWCSKLPDERISKLLWN